jgi:enoyl-CoA hydratase/carnithine racemase
MRSDSRRGVGELRVVEKVFPDEDFDRRSRELAGELASGPTLAHAATKQVVRAYLDGGVELADERIARIAGKLFDSEDLKGGVRSFLEEGPGRATFAGR